MQSTASFVSILMAAPTIHFTLRQEGQGAESVQVDSTPTHLALMFSESETYTFDRAGRLVTAFNGHSHFWRGLSGRAVEKFSDPQKGKQIVPLSLAEADRLVFAARQRATGLDAGRIVAEVFARIQKYDPVEDRLVFDRTYGKVAILPPDQYLSLFLQAAVGCAWNRCTFCQFYGDHHYRVRTAAEFREHVRDVQGFLGDSVLLRRGIFLGDADILGVRQARLLEAMNIAKEFFPGRPFYGFCEAASAARKTGRELEGLRERGFRRLYIGAESGHDRLLAHYQKRSRAANIVAAVNALKETGLCVGLIFLTGVEPLFGAAHVCETIRLLESVPLDSGDLVYLSPLVSFEGGLEGSAKEEMERLRRGLGFLKEKGVKVAPYDVRQMIY
ncbi:MAG: radical SAM protein [Acidobacteria bacterium]|nr:radical SAM protein [Acidobacteriota bacterium]